MRKFNLLCVVTLSLTLAACGGGGPPVSEKPPTPPVGGGVTPVPPVPTAPTISGPSVVEVNAGGDVAYPFTITAPTNSTDPLVITAALPEGVSTAPVTVLPGSSPTTGELRFVATEEAQPGTYSVQVTVKQGQAANSTAVTVVVKSKPSGTFYRNFGSEGLAIVDNPFYKWIRFTPTKVALDNAGRILILGSASTKVNDNYYVDHRVYVARFQTNGQLDTSFGGAGIAFVDPSLEDETAHAFHITNSGHILIPMEIGESTAVARLTVNGELDKTFSQTGIVQHQYSRPLSRMRPAISPEGKMTLVDVVAREGSPDQFDVQLLQLSADGKINLSFGAFGRLTIPLQRGAPLTARAAYLPGGELILGFNQLLPGNDRIAVKKINSNGSIDESFNLYVDHVDTNDYLNDLVATSDGSIFIKSTSEWLLPSTTVTKFDLRGGPEAGFGDKGEINNVPGGWFEVTSDGQIATGHDLLTTINPQTGLISRANLEPHSQNNFKPYMHYWTKNKIIGVGNLTINDASKTAIATYAR